MERITDYTVIEMCGADYHIPIEHRVLQMMKDGWQPQGGIAIGEKGNRMQVMVKFDTTVTDQINDIHSVIVVDLPHFIQNWNDHMSYPRAVTISKG